jgi:hypothetical protein
MPGILVTSTSGLIIANNHLELKPAAVPAMMRRAGMNDMQPVVRIKCGANNQE